MPPPNWPTKNNPPHPLRPTPSTPHAHMHSPKDKEQQDKDWALVYARAWADPGFRDDILGKTTIQQKWDALEACGLNPHFHGHDSIHVYEDEAALLTAKAAGTGGPNALYRLLPPAPHEDTSLWNLHEIRHFRQTYAPNTGAF